MADVVNAAKHSGTYTPEDEIMIHKKAHAITNCYIDSSVPPKVQVISFSLKSEDIHEYIKHGYSFINNVV